MTNFFETIGRGVINPDLLSPELKEPQVISGDNSSSTPMDQSWISNFFQIIGRGMIDPDLLDPEAPSPKAELSCHYTTDGLRLPHCRFGCINGMNTPFERMKSHAQYLTQFIPNQSIDWVYNRTHGSVSDTVEIFGLNYPGISPNTSDLLIENWTKFHKDNKDRPNAKFLQFCYSQGSMHTKNALTEVPKEIRNRIIVIAIAPGKIVPEDLCFKSFNYASKNDIVHYGELLFAGLIDISRFGLSNSLILALEKHKQLVLLEPHPDAKGIDHDFQSPTFKEVIEYHIKEYIDHNGEYE